MKIHTGIIHEATGEEIVLDPIESLMEYSGLSREGVVKMLKTKGFEWVYKVMWDEFLDEETNRKIAQEYYEAALDEIRG
jgi:hypothetical protein